MNSTLISDLMDYYRRSIQNANPDAKWQKNKLQNGISCLHCYLPESNEPDSKNTKKPQPTEISKKQIKINKLQTIALSKLLLLQSLSIKQ